MTPLITPLRRTGTRRPTCSTHDPRLARCEPHAGNSRAHRRRRAPPRPPRSPASPQTSPPTPRPASPLTPRPSPPPHQPNLQPAPNPPRSTDLWRSGSPPNSALVRKTTTSPASDATTRCSPWPTASAAPLGGDVAATVAVNAAIRAFEEGKPLPEALISANAAVMQICEWLGSPETGSTPAAGRPQRHRARSHRPRLGGRLDGFSAARRSAEPSHRTRPAPPDSNALVSAVGYLPEPAPRTAHARVARGDRVLYAPTACGKRSTRRAWPSSSPQAKTRRG